MWLMVKPISNKGVAMGGGGGELDDMRRMPQKFSSDSDPEKRRLLTGLFRFGLASGDIMMRQI